MKKILLSLLTVGVLGAGVYGVTNAFFNDTETSTGNILQAGAIDLKVDSKCTYNGQQSEQCGTWDASNLTNEKFFNFSDLKPGDVGENTISLDLSSNPARACAIIQNMHDDDPTLTEPEQEDGDNTQGNDVGELSPALHFFAWADDGNNLWESGELPLFSNVSGPASDVLNGKSYDLGTLQPGTTYMGLYWCYGNLTVDQDNNLLTCDGSTANNVSQTDLLTADIKFYVEQARNNENFVCPQAVNTQR